MSFIRCSVITVSSLGCECSVAALSIADKDKYLQSTSSHLGPHEVSVLDAIQPHCICYTQPLASVCHLLADVFHLSDDVVQDSLRARTGVGMRGKRVVDVGNVEPNFCHITIVHHHVHMCIVALKCPNVRVGGSASSSTYIECYFNHKANNPARIASFVARHSGAEIVTS